MRPTVELIQATNSENRHISSMIKTILITKKVKHKSMVNNSLLFYKISVLNASCTLHFSYYTMGVHHI